VCWPEHSPDYSPLVLVHKYACEPMLPCAPERRFMFSSGSGYHYELSINTRESIK
jgi:hypothetical protein